MNLKKTTLFSSLYAGIRVLTGMVSMKVMAVLVGPAGVAYVGQFQSFLNIVSNLSNVGIGNGVIKYLAQFRENREEYARVLSTSFLMVFSSSVLLSVTTLLFARPLSEYLFQTPDYSFVLVVFALTLVLYSGSQLLAQALNGFQETQKLLKGRIAATLLGLVVTVSLVLLFGVEGALLGLVLSQVVGFFILLLFSKRSRWFIKTNFLKGADRGTLKRLLAFSLMTFSSIILLELRQLYLRNYLITALSPEAAGHWQAIWKISEIYLMVVTTSLSVYYLPKLSAITEPGELRSEIFKGYRFILPVVLVLSTAIFLSRDLIITVLFTEDFAAIRELFLFQLVGDVLKISSWLLSFLLVARAMTKTYIVTELVFISLFAALAIWLVPVHGVIGLTYAFAINYFLYLITMVLIFRQRLLKKH